MPISKASIENLKAQGINIEAIIEAVNSRTEMEVPVPSGKFYSDDDVNTLKENVKKGHEKAYPEIFGKEINAKYELGLTPSEAKDHDKLLSALQDKAISVAKLEPNKKVEELQASLRKLQEEVIPQKEQAVNEWKSKYEQREEFDRYASLIPENANKYLTKEEHVARVRKAVQWGENGVAIDPSTGKAYKGELEKDMHVKDVVAKLYKENEGWSMTETPAAAKPFHHSSNGSATGRQVGAFDYDKAWGEISQKHNVNTVDGRQAAQREMTAMQVQHTQANQA